MKIVGLLECLWIVNVLSTLFNKGISFFQRQTTLSCVGFGLYWATTKGLMNAQIFEFPQQPSEINALFILYLGLEVALTILLLAARKRLPRIASLLESAWPPALISSIGLIGLSSSSSIPALAIATACVSLGISLFFLAWVCAMGRFAPHQVPLVVASMFMLGNIFSIIFSVVGRNGAESILIAYFFLSAICFERIKRADASIHPISPQSSNQSKRLIIEEIMPSVISLFSVSLASIAVSYVLIVHESRGIGTQIVAHLAGPAIGSMAAIVAAKHLRPNNNHLYLLYPIMAAIVLLVPYFNEVITLAAKATMMAAVEYLLIFTLARGISICCRKLENLLRIGSIAWLTLCSSTLLGVVAGSAFTSLNTGSRGLFMYLGVFTAYLFLTMLCLTLYKRKPTNDKNEIPEKNDRVNEFATFYGLTNRQTEVMELLVQGRSVSYIAKELCLSPDTVKGHVRILYQKTNIHSKQELIDLFQMKG